MSKSIKILAIESSCDETAAAVLEAEDGKIKIASNQVSSQIKLHSQWGGVVPNLAAREHVKNLPLVIEKALSGAKINPQDIDIIASVSGPGLIPALLTGLNFSKTLSYLWEKPLIGIHHIEGHIYSNLIIPGEASTVKIDFPCLILVVSGGHTQLVFMENDLEYEIVGQTLDDAVGEAFDKVARILDVGYPGGPAISQRADKYVSSENEYNINLPRPMLNSKDLNFSFSGLKTAVLYETKKNPELLQVDSYINAVCHEFQEAATDVLVSKTIKATKKYSPRTIMLAGGVSANKRLREKLKESVKKDFQDIKYLVPDMSLTGDNAAMIGAAAYFRWKKMNILKKMEAKKNWKTLKADANLKLK